MCQFGAGNLVEIFPEIKEYNIRPLLVVSCPSLVNNMNDHGQKLDPDKTRTLITEVTT